MSFLFLETDQNIFSSMTFLLFLEKISQMPTIRMEPNTITTNAEKNQMMHTIKSMNIDAQKILLRKLIF